MATAFVFGAATVDLRLTAFTCRMGDSNEGRMRSAPGGVGRNIAENLVRMGVETTLVCPLGPDENGALLARHAAEQGYALLPVPAEATPAYAYVMHGGDLVVAMNQMRMVETALTPATLAPFVPAANAADYVVIDANLSRQAIEYLCAAIRAPKVFDGVSAIKCVRAQAVLGAFDTVKLNWLEAAALCGQNTEEEAGLAAAAQGILEQGAARVFITRAGRGCFCAEAGAALMLAVTPLAPVDTNGAGDAFTAALVLARLRGLALRQSAELAHQAAALSLMHEGTVCPAVAAL